MYSELADCRKLLKKHYEHYNSNQQLQDDRKLNLEQINEISIEELADHANYWCKQMHKEEKDMWHLYCIDELNNVFSIDFELEIISEGHKDDEMLLDKIPNIAYFSLNAPEGIKQIFTAHINYIKAKILDYVT